MEHTETITATDSWAKAVHDRKFKFSSKMCKDPKSVGPCLPIICSGGETNSGTEVADGNVNDMSNCSNSSYVSIIILYPITHSLFIVLKKFF